MVLAGCSTILASRGVSDIRRREEDSPRINFICSLSSELDSASSLPSSLMLSWCDIEELPEVDCCLWRLGKATMALSTSRKTEI
jgi:hypothetical protein